MFFTPLYLLSTTLAVFATPSTTPHDKRASLPLQSVQVSPYAPHRISCPTDFKVRRSTPAVPLNPLEADYVQQKRAQSGSAWTSYLTGAGLINFDIATFVASTSNLPVISIAVSGGGERAMLVGGGIIAGFDGRNTSAVKAGTGGILQVSTYVAGLSGGSWCIGSFALAGFPTFQQLRDQVWDLVDDFLAPRPSQPTLLSDGAISLAAKQSAGFNISFNDYFGRSLSYHLINDTPHNPSGPGSATLWHSIRSTSKFMDHSAPFPIVIALGREQGQTNVTLTSPIYEFTPYEFGTTDPTIGSAFIPIEYLGSELTNGLPAKTALNCVAGFDNAGFVMATSGEFFGSPVQLAIQEAALTPADTLTVEKISGMIPDNYAVDARIPSPFKGLNPSTYAASKQVELDLVDGGMAGENVPFTPLLQAARKVDVIIAIDASADTNNYPDGQEPYHTYQKSLLPGYAGAFPFPYFPPPAQFVAAGLNKRISFFGSICNGQAVVTPLIVYIPNHFINFATNTSTFTPTYSVADQISFFNNGFAIATQNQSPSWSSCLACAVIDTAVKRSGGVRTDQCQSCFTKYCYTGKA